MKGASASGEGVVSGDRNWESNQGWVRQTGTDLLRGTQYLAMELILGINK